MKFFKWTSERIDALKMLWNDGCTASQIAEEIGAPSKNSVIGKAHRVGLTHAGRTARAPIQLAAPAPRPIPRPAPQRPIEAAGVTLMDLRGASCRWPMGRDADDEQWLFCGAARGHGPYCQDHHSLAYTSQASKVESQIKVAA